jgi:DNA-binding response OmpR family regulator
MSDSILNGKRILIVDDEPDVLAILEEEIMLACPNCTLEKAGTYESATALLVSKAYDAVILDIMGVRGFDLLDTAVKRGFRVAMLTAHALSPEVLKRSIEMKAHAYLPKEKLGEIVPFLEDLLRYDYESGWMRLFEKLHKYFTGEFGEGWETDPDAPWHDWLHGKYL